MSEGIEVDPLVAGQVRDALDGAADRVVLDARTGGADAVGGVDVGSASVAEVLDPWVDWAVTSCAAAAGAVWDLGVDAARAAGVFAEADRVLAGRVSAGGMRAL